MHYFFHNCTLNMAVDADRPKQAWLEIQPSDESTADPSLPYGVSGFGTLFLAVLAAQVSGVGVAAQLNSAYYPVSIRLWRDSDHLRHVSVVLWNTTFSSIEDHVIPASGPVTLDEYIADDFWQLLMSPKMVRQPISHTPTSRDPVLTIGPVFGTNSVNGVPRQIRFQLDNPNTGITDCDLIDRGATISLSNGLNLIAGCVERQLGGIGFFSSDNDLFLTSHSHICYFWEVSWDANGLPAVTRYERSEADDEWRGNLTISSPTFVQVMFGCNDYFERAKATLPLSAQATVDLSPVLSAVSDAVSSVNSHTTSEKNATTSEIATAVTQVNEHSSGLATYLGREITLAISQISALSKEDAYQFSRAILIGVGEALMPPDQWRTHSDHVIDLRDTLRRTFPDLLGDIDLFGDEPSEEE